MTQPGDTIRGSLSLAGAEKPRQDTVVLTEDPDATVVSGSNSGISISAPELANATLSSGALAALGQRYDVLGEAGHGSMGSVYKARDRETNEVVALKLLKPEIASDQKMVDRFKNELLYARKITHKNVCRVYDFNRAGSIAFTSMEFVEGESLRSVLNRFGGLPQRKAIHVALQICSGLKEAHAQGIVHRDLKPENVMMDTHGNVKIMDFGIARSMEMATNLTGSMVGTPAYMSPEQVSGKPVDFRTDIYSLGLMLYEMFTGSQAFQADTAMAVALKQVQEIPAPPHDLDPNVPVQIERVILKCLEKDPAKRFQTMEELEKALSAFGRPVGAPTAAATVATMPNVAFAPRPVAPVKQASRGTWAFMWVLLGAASVIAAGAGAKWMATAKQIAQMQPPPSAAAPKLPDFVSAALAAVPPAGQPATKPQTKKVFATAADVPVIDKPKEANSANDSPAPITPAKQQTPSQPVATPVSATASNMNPQQTQQLAPDDNTATTFLWVGRFQKEDRAQSTTKKLEGLKLPAMVVPRNSPQGEFYVVLTGPFPNSRLAGVTQLLESNGFQNIHEFKLPQPNQKPVSNPR